MTTYIKISTQEYPLHEGDIILAHPELEFNFVTPQDYAVVHYREEPEVDKSKYILEPLFPSNIDGIWTVDWMPRELTEKEIEQRKELPEVIKKLEEKRNESQVQIPNPLPII